MDIRGRGGVSRWCWIRTLFLGLPILWLVVVTLMLVNLTLDNVSHRGHELRDGHNHDYQHTIENRNLIKEVTRDQTPQSPQFNKNPAPEAVVTKKRIGKIPIQIGRGANNQGFLPPVQKDAHPMQADIKEIKGDHLERNKVVNKNNPDRATPRTYVHVQPSTYENQPRIVVNVSSLMHIPDIHRLAAIFQPAKSQESPGELGRGIQIQKERLKPEEKKIFDHGWKVNAFNQLASDRMSVHRRLPAVQEPGCKNISYPPLPDTTVIICFHNEALSVLLRTVHSVINRSPPHLLTEIILVDDFSDQDHLREPLEAYLSMLPKTKLLRTEKREGLVRARLLGYSVAKGTVLTFLDSHCECSEGWLEPLLGPIAEDKQSVVAPIIDTISDTTLVYMKTGRDPSNIPVGVFDWNMLFHWGHLSIKSAQQRKHVLEPVRTPTIAGGLFAINKDYFTNIGTYDEGMEIWGGENLEISFRVWLCGGRLLIAPCSHVGHIFRKTSPYNRIPGQNVLQKNSMRAAEVWLDEYKWYYYERFNYKNVNFGDVSDRLALKKRLNCHPFEWYLKNIYPDLYVPSDTTAAGEIINLSFGICLEVGDKVVTGPVKVFGCHGQGGNQFFYLNSLKQIRRDNHCMTSTDENVDVEPCHDTSPQKWLYREDQALYNILEKACMDYDGKKLFLAPCSGVRSQKWVWKRRSETGGNF